MKPSEIIEQNGWDYSDNKLCTVTAINKAFPVGSDIMQQKYIRFREEVLKIIAPIERVDTWDANPKRTKKQVLTLLKEVEKILGDEFFI